MTTSAATGWLLSGALVAALVTTTAVPTESAPVAASSATVEPRIGPVRRPPVDARPSRPFEAPAHEYGPGHRGVDLPAGSGTVVVSPAAGTVTFAGPVAGRGVMVVAHAGGTLTSLEPVEPVVAVGTAVAVGGAVGIVADAPVHAGCPAACLHWGVRVDGRYVDPWWWLGRTGPVRLLPLSDR